MVVPTSSRISHVILTCSLCALLELAEGGLTYNKEKWKFTLSRIDEYSLFGKWWIQSNIADKATKVDISWGKSLSVITFSIGKTFIGKVSWFRNNKNHECFWNPEVYFIYWWIETKQDIALRWYYRDGHHLWRLGGAGYRNQSQLVVIITTKIPTINDFSTRLLSLCILYSWNSDSILFHSLR